MDAGCGLRLIRRDDLEWTSRFINLQTVLIKQSDVGHIFTDISRPCVPGNWRKGFMLSVRQIDITEIADIINQISRSIMDGNLCIYH